MAKFLFVLSKDDNESATRCFQLARLAHGKGHHVHLFFLDAGVSWADAARDLRQPTVTGDCPLDYLPYLVDHEVEIFVHAPCAAGRGIDEEHFHPNMRPADGLCLIELAAEANVVNF